MPVPDEVIFGPAHPSGQLTYGRVRALVGDDRYWALKRRLDSFLVEQTNELGKPEGGSSNVYAPFPLFLLTCVAVETLGKVLHRPAQKMGDEDAQRGARLLLSVRLLARNVHVAGGGRPIVRLPGAIAEGGRVDALGEARLRDRDDRGRRVVLDRGGKTLAVNAA